MKYCTKCGQELFDDAIICTKCGRSVVSEQKTEQKTPIIESSTVQTIAKAFMIVSTVILGLYLIPLAWCLPMTISYCNKIKTGQPVSTAFKVCTLLFVSVIAGIAMFFDESGNK